MKRTLIILILYLAYGLSFSQEECNIESKKQKILNEIKSKDNLDLFKAMPLHYTGKIDTSFEEWHRFLWGGGHIYRLYIYGSNEYKNDLIVTIKRYYDDRVENKHVYFDETKDNANDTQITIYNYEIDDPGEYKIFLSFEEKREGCGFAILAGVY